MVPVSGQPLVHLGMVRNPKTTNFYVFLINVFLRPVQVQTDLTKRGNILIMQHRGRLRKFYLSLAILPA